MAPTDPLAQSARVGADRCPGALTPFSAEDGLIVRVRIPGGEIPVDALATLLAIGVEYGAPGVQLTTRANLQVRGLPDPLPPDVASRIADAGLLPSLTHERARNILAAPTSPGLRAGAREFDRLLCARPALAELPGRFLFLLTDQSGLGLTERYDIAYVDRPSGDGLLMANGLVRMCSRSAAYDAMLDIAERFLAARTDERTWNLRDLTDLSAVLEGFSPRPAAVAPTQLSCGTTGEDLVVGVPLGLLGPSQLDVIRTVADRVVVTPWRSLMIEGGAKYADRLATAGLITTADSAWTRISACTGAPYCARATSETLGLARECAGSFPADGPRVHLAGCERRCGAPLTSHVSVVGAASVDDVRASVASSP